MREQHQVAGRPVCKVVAHEVDGWHSELEVGCQEEPKRRHTRSGARACFADPPCWHDRTEVTQPTAAALRAVAEQHLPAARGRLACWAKQRILLQACHSLAVGAGYDTRQGHFWDLLLQVCDELRRGVRWALLLRAHKCVESILAPRQPNTPACLLVCNGVVLNRRVALRIQHFLPDFERFPRDQLGHSPSEAVRFERLSCHGILRQSEVLEARARRQADATARQLICKLV
eukprot:802788-Prymnesium_polylepis.2